MNNKMKVIIGISLPVIVILFIIGSIVFPRLFFHPKYDFVYTVDPVCPNYNCQYYPYDGSYTSWRPYTVVDGKIMKTQMPEAVPLNPPPPVNSSAKTVGLLTYPPLYRYDVSTNVFKQISFDEAQGLSLTDGGSAPDGTVVVNQNSNGGLIGDILGGGGGRGYGLYIRNGSLSKPIVVQNASQPDYYSSNFRLIGWVK